MRWVDEKNKLKQANQNTEKSDTLKPIQKQHQNTIKG